MAAPDDIKWGNIITNSNGDDTTGVRIGLLVSLSDDSTTEATVTAEVWFWSKYSCVDSTYSLYVTDDSVDYSISNPPSINTTVESGGGWSEQNKVKLGTYSKTYDKKATSQWANISARVESIGLVDNEKVTVYSNYTIPALPTIQLTLDANGGSGGTSYVYYKYNINQFYSDADCNNAISNISLPSRLGYSFVQYDGDGTHGGTVDERYIYSDGTFASDLCSDIYEDATLYAQWKPLANLFQKVNGQYKDGATRVKSKGVWREGKQIYKKVNGIWKLKE